MCDECKKKKFISLMEKYPELCKEWDYEKNIDLSPLNVGYASGKKVWWICKKCDHKWDATISNRAGNQSRCPSCIGRVTTQDNCLETLFPELSKQWHSIKNGDLTPKDVRRGSAKQVWWICPKEDCRYEWKASIHSRVSGNGCKACANKIVTERNCLAALFPQVAEDWHPTKNGNLLPKDVSYGSTKKVWWLCKICGHVWQTAVGDRTKPKNALCCPGCSGRAVTDKNRLSVLFPELCKEWHPTKNGDLTPNDVSYGSDRKVWWLCLREDCKYEWEASMYARKIGQGCKACAGKVATNKNCLATNYPEVAKQWHPTKNDKTPNDVTKGSGKYAWWLCPDCGREWEAKIYSRTIGGNGCSCGSKAISKAGSKWLDEKGVPNTKENREVRIYINKSKYFVVDGYIPETKTVYEYLGKFFHGHPEKHNPNDINPVTGEKFGDLYQETLDRLAALEAAGYTVIYKWGR